VFVLGDQWDVPVSGRGSHESIGQFQAVAGT
jgi:hypothetical protein